MAFPIAPLRYQNAWAQRSFALRHLSKRAMGSCRNESQPKSYGWRDVRATGYPGCNRFILGAPRASRPEQKPSNHAGLPLEKDDQSTSLPDAIGYSSFPEELCSARPSLELAVDHRDFRLQPMTSRGDGQLPPTELASLRGRAQKPMARYMNRSAFAAEFPYSYRLFGSS